MKFLLALASGCLCLIVTTASAQPTVTVPDVDAEVAEKQVEPDQREVTVFRLENAAAGDVSEILSQLYRRDSVEVVPDAATNTLFLHGSEKDLESISQLIEVIDRAPATIDIEVTILETAAEGDASFENVKLTGEAASVAATIKRLQGEGRLRVLERLRTTAVENQVAMIQVGKQQPVTRGRTMRSPSRDLPGGSSAPVMSMEDFGTLLNTVSRVSGEEVMIELKVEKSWIQPGESVSDDETAEFLSTTDKLSIQSTLKVATGEVAYVGGKVIEANGRRSRLLVLLTANIQR